MNGSINTRKKEEFILIGSDKRIRDAADFIGTTLGIVKLPVELLDRPERSVFAEVASDSVEMKFGCNECRTDNWRPMSRVSRDGWRNGLCSATGKE